MLNSAGLVRFATAITPFAKAGEQKGQKRRSKESDLSDDEELEKIQLEQGRATIDRLVEANDFDPEVSEMLRNVLTLSETLTREIMVPRTDMICMDRTATLADMLRLCSRSGFSRVPVIGDDVDDLIGVAYLKDAVRATAFNPAASQRDVASIVRQPMLVPESKPVDDLFHAMQQTRQHVAIVVDEYGSTLGLVSLEDIIEEIVGEISDESDADESFFTRLDEKCFIFDGKSHLGDFERVLGLDEEIFNDVKGEAETLAGLMLELKRDFPRKGDVFTSHDIRFTVQEMDGHRIDKIRVDLLA